MEIEMEAKVPNAGATPSPQPTAGQPGLGGEVDFLTALKRPGANPTHPFGADLLKILVQGAAGAPGGLPGMAMNFGQIAVNPKSLRPLLTNDNLPTLGNPAELAAGLLPQGLRMIPGVKQAADAAPRLFGALTGSAGGAGMAAADVHDRGGDTSTASKIGGVLGGLFGFGGAQLHGMANRLPSPTAQKIEDNITALAGAPPNAPAVNNDFRRTLNILAGAPAEARTIEATAAKGGLQNQLLSTFTRLADKFRPTAKGAQTAAAEAKARFQNAGTLTGIAENSDIDAAKDFLRIDYRKQLFDLNSERRALESKYTGPSQNLPWYRAKISAIDSKLAELESQRNQAIELTRRTEAAASKATTSTLNAEASGGPLAKAAREAEMLAKKQTAKLGSFESAANKAEVGGMTAGVEQAAARDRLADIFTAAGVNPSNINDNGKIFMSILEPHKDKLTLSDAVKIGMQNDELADGLVNLLLNKGPEALASARGKLLFDTFEKARTGVGGKGQYPQIYNGTKLVKSIEDMEPAAVNTFFGNKSAHHDLLALAQSAADAQKLAEFHKVAGGVGSLLTTSAGAVAMHSMGRTVTDPTTGAVLILTAGGTLAAVNVPMMIESSIQSNGILGNLLTQYIKSKNPDKLPTAVTAALSKFVTPLKYKTTDQKSPAAQKRYEVY